MLGFIGFLAICLFAALFPVATALIIFVAVVVMAVQDAQKRGRK